MKYRISSNNSREWLLLISPKKGPIIQGKEIIWGRQWFQILLTGSSTLNILFYYPIKLKKKITSNKLDMSFLSVSNLVPCLIFSVNILGVRAWIVTGQFCWIRLHFNLTGRGLKKEKVARGEGWTIIWRRRLFSIFPSKGSDYMREAISRGTAIIRGNMVVCPLNYKSSFFEYGRPKVLIVFRFIF